MIRQFTLEYWIDDSWYVGRLKEVPFVFSQGESLQELEENIQDAYNLMIDDEPLPSLAIHTKEMAIKV
jgi:predicted RNase H-like HicB family nuclease